MNLYESLVKNIGIGIEPINKRYIQKVFSKPTSQQWAIAFCNRYDLVPSIYDLREVFKEVDSQKVHAEWLSYLKDVVYELSYKSDVDHIDEVIVIGDEGISIIDDLRNCKKYYEKLDKLFKKHSIVKKEDYFNSRTYLWKDCRYSIESLMTDNSLMKQLNESLVSNVGIDKSEYMNITKI